MRVVFLIFASQIFITSILAQIEIKDSVYYRGKYYNQAEYEKVKTDFEKYNFDERFMPGIGYGFYLPSKSDSIGAFHGISVKYLFYRDVSQNTDPGPSHLDFYAKLNLLKSIKDSISQVFIYSLGVDLSFEKNPNRFFFIPYFGLEIGGLSQKNFGTTIQFTPTVGIHILSKKNISIDLTTGYVYPVRNFETLAGWYGDVCLNFVLW
jgi:hypothetical protein